MKNKTKTSFYIDDDLLMALKHRAVDEKTNNTTIIVKAIKDYLAKPIESDKAQSKLVDNNGKAVNDD